MKWWAAIRAAVLRLKPGEQRVYVSPRQAGVLVNEDTAMTLPEWWACVAVLSRTIASLPWGVFERTANGRERVDGMVAWLLNHQPNPEMTAFSFREALVAHMLNWGNGYAEIQRDLAGRPSALWLLTPDRVCPERDTGTRELYYSVRNEDGSETRLEAANVLHVHGLGFDGLVGYSVPRMAARSIGIGIAQDSFGQAFYANGTSFGSVLEVPARMTPEQIADQEKYMNDGYGGPSKAFKTKVIANGWKMHDAPSMPLTDAQFVESRGMSVTTVARLLGVPPHKIADLSRSTNNNIEHQGIEFVTDAIVPLAMRFEQEANIKLFGARAQGRVYTKMNVSALMRGDSKARAEFYRVMITLGVMSVNEVRELEELNGIGPAGDAHLVQINQTTLEWLTENPGAKSAEPAEPTEPSEGDPQEPAVPTNVIRAQALEWARSQRKQA